ncbi:hypothetical protein ACFSM7_05690 [Clavibacter michiganensis subsp. tessellarius]
MSRAPAGSDLTLDSRIPDLLARSVRCRRATRGPDAASAAVAPTGRRA